MAQVQLIDYTGKGRPDEQWHAADMLIFTKQTRLEMSSGLLEQVKAWPVEKKQKELNYMATTIPSSWEFADVTFLVTGLSRAGQQQMTRTRTGSYAAQSLRVVDASELGVVNPLEGTLGESAFKIASHASKHAYRKMVEAGIPAQDARGILPLNTESNIVCKYNLRNVVQLIAARSSLRVQGEYSDVIDQMKQQIIAAWPWSEPFFKPKNELALQLLGELVEELGLEVGKGAGWKIAKAMDLLR